jgi:hypothetical protein
MSRKYTDEGLAALVSAFQPIASESSNISEQRDHFGIVTKLLCLKDGSMKEDQSHPAAQTRAS